MSAIDAAGILVGADAVDALLEGREPSQLRVEKGQVNRAAFLVGAARGGGE